MVSLGGAFLRTGAQRTLMYVSTGSAGKVPIRLTTVEILVGAERFELPTLWSQTRCASQTALRPENIFLERISFRREIADLYLSVGIFSLRKECAINHIS